MSKKYFQQLPKAKPYYHEVIYPYYEVIHHYYEVIHHYHEVIYPFQYKTITLKSKITLQPLK